MDADLCPKFPLAAPILQRGACINVARRWSPAYLATAVQDGLLVTVDVAPRQNGAHTGLFPDTVDERAATGVFEVELEFQHVLRLGHAWRSTEPLLPASPQPRNGCHKCGFVFDSLACEVCGTVPLAPPPFRPPAATATQVDPARQIVYLQQQPWPFRVLFPQLQRDLVALCESAVLQRCIDEATASVLWLGTGTARSQLHKDRKDNVICQVLGTKTIKIWAPSEESAMYPRADTDGTGFQDRFSQISLGLPDQDIAARFPLFQAFAPTLEVTVEAGDVLFLPANWWHQVDSAVDVEHGVHLMVNSFFDL